MPPVADAAALTRRLWSIGDLSYLLYPHQEAAALLWKQSWKRSRKFYLECSRRWGKSFWLCVEAVQMALTTPGAQIRYAAPTARMVRTIVEPHFNNILADCPEEIAPRYRRQDGMYEFHNGSVIHVVGCDNGGHERLRGAATHLALVDEAAFIDLLKYVVNDVLLPQTITTDGMLLLASTPGHSPSHDAFDISRKCRLDDAYAHRTIIDCDHIPPHLVAEYMREAGGATSTTWRREYLAEWVVDSERAVVPEWLDVRDACIAVSERPAHFRSIVGADVGFNDLTVCLFGYYDFQRAILVVEDEVVCPKMTSEPIDDAVWAKEVALGYVGSRAPIMRVADATPLVIAELNLTRQRKKRTGGWVAARKDDAEAQLNAMRVAIAARKVFVHPRCQTLIDHLGSAVWNVSRTTYQRQEGLGHFDGVDALKYMWRHLDRQTNPFPGPMPSATQWYRPLAGARSDDALSRAMTPKHRRPS